MKKINLLLTVVFLFVGIGSANAVPFTWDLSGTAYTATVGGVAGQTDILYPTDITTSGGSTISQSLTGGLNDAILDNGDTFSDLGGLTVLSAGDLGGTPFPSETSLSFQHSSGAANAYIVFEGLTGYITDHTDGGTATTNAATIIDDTFGLTFTPGAGTIKFFLDTDFDPTNAGTTLELASLSLVSGTGTSPFLVEGFNEGQFGITAAFLSVLDDFWYLPGAPPVDFDDWMATYGIPSIFATSFNLGATALGASDSGGNILLNVANEGSFIISAVPEPATMLLFGIGLLGLAGVTRKKVS